MVDIHKPGQVISHRTHRFDGDCISGQSHFINYIHHRVENDAVGISWQNVKGESLNDLDLSYKMLIYFISFHTFYFVFYICRSQKIYCRVSHITCCTFHLLLEAMRTSSIICPMMFISAQMIAFAVFADLIKGFIGMATTSSDECEPYLFRVPSISSITCLHMRAAVP